MRIAAHPLPQAANLVSQTHSSPYRPVGRFRVGNLCRQKPPPPFQLLNHSPFETNAPPHCGGVGLALIKSEANSQHAFNSAATMPHHSNFLEENMSNVMEIGKQLVELCKQNKNVQAVDTLYSPNIVSIELMEMPGMPRRMEGIDAIRGKNQWWLNNHDVHKTEAFGPYPHDDRFIVVFRTDVTPKVGPHAGKRMQFEEAGLYTVKDGKIAQEEFFYAM
jgi:hypothetical protein